MDKKPSAVCNGCAVGKKPPLGGFFIASLHGNETCAVKAHQMPVFRRVKIVGHDFDANARAQYGDCHIQVDCSRFPIYFLSCIRLAAMLICYKQDNSL